MPLSDDEQKLLDALEAQLHADDPRFARTFRRAGAPVRDRRRIGLGVLGIIVGLALLITSVALSAVWLGILAFALMAISGVWAATAPARPEGGGSAPGGGASGEPGTGGGRGSDFMQRMEERWERRSDPDGHR